MQGEGSVLRESSDTDPHPSRATPSYTIPTVCLDVGQTSTDIHLSVRPAVPVVVPDNKQLKGGNEYQGGGVRGITAPPFQLWCLKWYMAINRKQGIYESYAIEGVTHCPAIPIVVPYMLHGRVYIRNDETTGGVTVVTVVVTEYLTGSPSTRSTTRSCIMPVT